MTRNPAAVAVVALALAGCASLPRGDPQTDAALKQFAAKPDVASLYVYCDEYMGLAISNVAIDGEPLGQLGTYTYLHAALPPGHHSVTSTVNNVDSVELDVAAGSVHYVRHEKKWGWPLPAAKLHVVPEEEGRKGVRNADYRVASHRFDDQRGLKAAAVAGTTLIVLLPLAAVYALPGVGAAAIFAGAH